MALGKNVPETLSKEWDAIEKRLRECGTLEELFGTIHEYVLRSAARLSNLEAHVSQLEDDFHPVRAHMAAEEAGFTHDDA